MGVGCAGHGADSRRVTGLTCTSTLSAGTDSVISTTGPIGPAHSQHTAQGSQAVVLDTPDGGSHMFGMVCDNEVGASFTIHPKMALVITMYHILQLSLT